MLSFRDVVVIGAVVALIMWWFKRRCGCAHPQPMRERPSAPTARPAPSSAPRRGGCMGLAPCGGR
jgi:hypothetical protein